MVDLPPLKEGATKGITLDMDALLQDFLKVMEWDLVTGRPSAQRLIELGLKDVAEDVW